MAIRKGDYHPPAESLLARVGRVIAVGPFRVFLGADLMPQGDESGIAHEFRRVTLHVMPEAGAQVCVAAIPRVHQHYTARKASRTGRLDLLERDLRLGLEV